MCCRVCHNRVYYILLWEWDWKESATKGGKTAQKNDKTQLSAIQDIYITRCHRKWKAHQARFYARREDCLMPWTLPPSPLFYYLYIYLLIMVNISWKRIQIRISLYLVNCLLPYTMTIQFGRDKLATWCYLCCPRCCPIMHCLLMAQTIFSNHDKHYWLTGGQCHVTWRSVWALHWISHSCREERALSNVALQLGLSIRLPYIKVYRL